ncbi:putative efflux pump membrane fusion protein [Thiorhodovibrio winogradskyi]|uniref:Efflux pump membrane fusion protein n=1 Tax=Thiorhodovibrio winogradskyi TaxID=77007 RepID=A0ABZ0S4L4_9GAMM|nr:efflux RND transporter periplasmic adaptor subunit [Thiorhodovibrio winogradskyi]
MREDLVLSWSRDHTSLHVRDPITEKIFEFGVEEAFLIESLRNPYDPRALMAEFQAKFDREEDPQALLEFLDILQGWGLLRESQGQDRDSPQPRAASSSLAPRASQVDPHPIKPLQPNGEEGPREAESNQRDAMPELQEEAEKTAQPGHWHLLRPEPVADALLRLMQPLRFFVWLIPLFLLYAVVAVWLNRDLVADSLASARLQFGLLGHLIFMGFTINLSIQIMRALVARRYGLKVPSFGLILAFGLIPRFNAQILLTPETTRLQRMWLSATPLLVRMVLFSLGTTFWLAMRPSGSLLSTIGAKLALIAAISFLLAATPLWSSDSYRLLANYARNPNLRERAKGALRALIFGRPRVLEKYFKDSPALVLFGAASVVFPATLIALIASILAKRLESNYQGAGVALFLFLAVYVTRHLLRQRAAERGDAPPARASRFESRNTMSKLPSKASPGRRETTSNSAFGPASGPGSDGGTKKSMFRVVRRSLFPLLLIACLFLPYPYEVGGNAAVLPSARHEIYPSQEGIVDRVFFSGGEWLSEGTVIAAMANHRQQKDVLATESAIEAKRHEIARLRTTPSAESIHLAEKQLEIARLESQYSIDKAERIEKLFNQGSVSVQSNEDAKKERDVAAQKVAESLANLDALKAQINPNEIAAEQAALDKLEQELTFFREELLRTYLRMPITGRIVTQNLQNLRSKYLAEGELFAVVEDARQVRVEIDVPESDISAVNLGSQVRFKAWMNPYQAFSGTVTEIAPEATAETFGPIVKVVAILPNPDGSLKTGMSGYGKIAAGDTLVIIAFTKALVRFFLIEIWSWLP